jgi:hypothetical protein
VVNPKTNTAIETGMVYDLEEDHDLPAEAILRHPFRQKEEPKTDVFGRVMYSVGADRGWHSRQEAKDRCIAEGVAKSTFNDEFSAADFIEKQPHGREIQWRLRN